MKRALLIAGGTVGGLGAVLAITPPQLTSSGSINIAGGAAMGNGGAIASASSSPSTKAVATQTAATQTPTKTSKPVATKKATAQASASASATASASASATPTAAATHSATPAAPATKSVSGTFTGPAIFVNYGTVQVKITVSNGHITDAVAVQAPSGRNDRYTQMAVPILKQQTLAAQSANIKGASGASYTSYGWFKSLQGALADAGL
jgi:uncharacterized protein with FMN-binding domain